MFSRILVLLSLSVAFALVTPRLHAAVSCPSSSVPPYYYKLELHNVTQQHSYQSDVRVGRVNVMGSEILAACVQDYEFGVQTLYAITVSGYPLTGLPGQSHMCWADYFGNGAGAWDIEILWKNEFHCGHQMIPFNYNGFDLISYTGSGANHFHGGAGIDIIYGGLGDDDLNEDVHAPGFPTSLYGAVYGEENNDFCVGQLSNSTLLRGGPGVDKLYDGGGSNDRLYGDAGNDCCVYDHGHSFAVLSCGTGNDGVMNLSGTSSCNYVTTSPTCTMLVAQCN
jgi:hypothetical protein